MSGAGGCAGGQEARGGGGSCSGGEGGSCRHQSGTGGQASARAASGQRGGARGATAVRGAALTPPPPPPSPFAPVSLQMPVPCAVGRAVCAGRHSTAPRRSGKQRRPAWRSCVLPSSTSSRRWRPRGGRASAQRTPSRTRNVREIGAKGEGRGSRRESSLQHWPACRNACRPRTRVARGAGGTAAGRGAVHGGAGSRGEAARRGGRGAGEG